MQNQDPMNPMEDTAYLAQLAQFTSLEQVSSLSDEVTSLRSDQQKAAAANYLGRTVTMDDGNGGTVTGEVTAVNTSEDTPTLEVDGTYYSLSSLISVTSSSSSSSSTTTTS